MRVGLLQLNFVVGDLEGNAEKIASAVKNTLGGKADLYVTSELSLLGYPPRDLLLQKSFIERGLRVLEELARNVANGPPVLVGTAIPNTSLAGRPLFNSAVLLHKGRVGVSFAKALLPTYDVFDEDRYFEPSQSPGILIMERLRIGVTICEDIWNDKDFMSHQLYVSDPVEQIMEAGNIDFFVNLSASPFTVGKQSFRELMFSSIAKKYKVPIIYVNQVGGNDDLVFDGRSCIFDREGVLITRANSFKEDVIIADVTKRGRVEEDDFTPESEIWRALVLGTRDYVHKCGFKSVLVGLSGGVDSALTAAIAVEAVGKENVLGVMMPSPYSSGGSIDDATEFTRRFGIRTITLPIVLIMGAYATTLKEVFRDYPEDVTEENIQSRIRGNLLMALSNKFGSLLLTTGNKSELAVGYCTIYGDMSGGLAVIADVPKTMIYRIARWVNLTKGHLIPEEIIKKPPSAELRPNQTDQDSLPPYDILDEILQRFIELHQGYGEIIRAGFDPEIVNKVLHLVRIAEFKRRQAAPGLKVTDQAFGTGWRIPIARADHERIF
ncbi:MAG: NAD+ synthase [Bacteroidota bacterium]